MTTRRNPATPEVYPLLNAISLIYPCSVDRLACSGKYQYQNKVATVICSVIALYLQGFITEITKREKKLASLKECVYFPIPQTLIVYRLSLTTSTDRSESETPSPDFKLAPEVSTVRLGAVVCD